MQKVNDYCVAVKNLKKDYGQKQALAGITLNIEKGEILGLVGPNGAGKTTFIKLLMGLLQPTSGSIRIFGTDIGAMTHKEWRNVGYISEEPNLYDFMTVQEIINFNSKFYPDWDKDRCSDLLAHFNLPLNEKIKNLSKGMQTQLSLVLAMVPMPQLLILDEPLEGLDPLRRINFLNLVLEDYMRKEGRTILISSHYLEEMERIADRIAFLNEGRLVRVAPMEQLRMEEKTIRVVFQKEPPVELLQMPGIKDIQREGTPGFLITVEDNFNAIFEACSRFPHYVLDIYHRNLEDLFHDYSGGDDRGV
ncbi:MAG: ABC transporter ATP-binding protein [Bacillota bacterium]